MELDTIYYFSCKSAEDRSPFLGKIPLKALNFDVQTQVSEEITQEYEFKLHTKERVFVFRAELVTDLNKWVASIEKIRSFRGNSQLSLEKRGSLGIGEGAVEEKEGFLLKKSMHKLNKYLGWEKRYVSFRKGTFFWSISNINTERRNTIQVKNLEKCEKIKENQFALVFYLVFLIFSIFLLGFVNILLKFSCSLFRLSYFIEFFVKFSFNFLRISLNL